MIAMKLRTRIIVVAAAAVVLWLALPGARLVRAAEPAGGDVRFNRDVRPILSDNCFQCHGPDKNQRKADLRLDAEASAIGDGSKPGAIVRGKPQASELFRRITSHE